MRSDAQVDSRSSDLIEGRSSISALISAGGAQSFRVASISAYRPNSSRASPTEDRSTTWSIGVPGMNSDSVQPTSSVRPEPSTVACGTPGGSTAVSAASRSNLSRSPRQQTRSTVSPKIHTSFDAPVENTASAGIRTGSASRSRSRRQRAAASSHGSRARSGGSGVAST